MCDVVSFAVYPRLDHPFVFVAPVRPPACGRVAPETGLCPHDRDRYHRHGGTRDRRPKFVARLLRTYARFVSRHDSQHSSTISFVIVYFGRASTYFFRTPLRSRTKGIQICVRSHGIARRSVFSYNVVAFGTIYNSRLLARFFPVRVLLITTVLIERRRIAKRVLSYFIIFLARIFGRCRAFRTSFKQRVPASHYPQRNTSITRSFSRLVAVRSWYRFCTQTREIRFGP